MNSAWEMFFKVYSVASDRGFGALGGSVKPILYRTVSL